MPPIIVLSKQNNPLFLLMEYLVVLLEQKTLLFLLKEYFAILFEQENGIILLWGSELDLDDVVGFRAVRRGDLEDYCSFDK